MAQLNRGAVLEAIIDVIAPYLGPGMARSAVTAHAQKLGFDEAQVTADQVEILLTKIGAGLNIFVGREKSATILARVKRVIEGAVGA